MRGIPQRVYAQIGPRKCLRGATGSQHVCLARRPHWHYPKRRGMTTTELLHLFKRLATAVVEKDFSSVSEGTEIASLGIDSLGMMEIIGAMERQLKIQIPDESLGGIQTVRDLIQVVERQQMAS